MRLFDAQANLIEDLKAESEVVAEKQGEDFRVHAVRHPTLGKLVLVVEADE